MKTLHVVSVNDDWVRCYVEGVLVAEAHSIEVSQQDEFTAVMKALGVTVKFSELLEGNS